MKIVLYISRNLKQCQNRTRKIKYQGVCYECQGKKKPHKFTMCDQNGLKWRRKSGKTQGIDKNRLSVYIKIKD